MRRALPNRALPRTALRAAAERHDLAGSARSPKRDLSQTQFVRYRQSGFWAYDVALGVFLKHLIDVAEEHRLEHEERWLVETVQWWRVVACVNSYGLALGEEWSAPQIATFLGLAREASVRIGRRESFAAAEMEAWSILDGGGVFARGASEVASGPIVELGEAIVALLEGELPSAPPGTTWFYGTPSGRRTLAMRSPDK
jgi:hypothetical protein